MTLAHFRGRGFPCDVVAGAELLRYNAATGRLEKQFNILPFLTDENQSWTIYPDNIIAADALGDGHDALYYMRSHSDGDKNEAMVLTSIAETKFKNRYVQESDLEHTFDWNSKYLGYCNQGEKWSTTYPDLELMWWYRHNGPEEWGHTAALCASNARYNDSHKTVRYTGFRRAYSEPRIHALIAAPPAYAPEETTSFFTPATHWCYSSDTEQPTTAASSITAGVVTGYEDETNTPLIATKLHNRDFAEAMQYECANALGSPANPSSPTGHYEARNEDIVIMQVTPYDVYTYQIIGAATIDQTDNHFTVSIPSKPVTFAITLSEYERLVADAPSAPDLRQVFRHKVGDPFSYPASNAEIRTNVLRSSVIWGKGQWDNWLTIGTDDISYRDLTLPETYSFATATELVDAATGIKTDSGYGYDANHSATTHTEGQGFTISCRSLTSVTLPSTVTTLGESAFERCYDLTAVTLPGAITSIPAKAFDNDYSLLAINLPPTVTEIGPEAFAYCWGLTTFTIPDAVTTIGDWAFLNCKFTEVHIGTGLTTLVRRPFDSCEDLAKIYLANPEPPTAAEEAFTKYTATLYVPVGSKARYSATNPRSRFAAIEETSDFGGVDNIVSDNDANLPVRYYRLDGTEVRTATPAPGLYIRMQGTRATKVLEK